MVLTGTTTKEETLNLTIVITMQRSDAVLELSPFDLPSQVEFRVPVLNERDAFVQFTYDELRVGGNADFTGIYFADGYWWVTEFHNDFVQDYSSVPHDKITGAPFSDVIVSVEVG